MINPLSRYLAIASLASTSIFAQTNAIPHLEKRGAATQLIVDGKPWLILGGELANTASSDLPYMDKVWPQLTVLNLNTVITGLGWGWVEPEEGKFDFSLVDGLLAGARKNHQHLIFIWFGSWKNSISSFAPTWVKRDTTRFPRVRIHGNLPVEILSPFSAESLAADRQAYVKFLEHLAQVDGDHTVLMIQLQNEIGVLGDSRDRSEAANAAFSEPVPTTLTEYINKNHERLSPPLRQLWEAAGAHTTGSWTDVFGSGPLGEEVFMAWHYGRYLESMAAAGKKAYPIPVFTNTWIVQPDDRGPGDYPSGGAKPVTLDVWKAAAPSVDLNCPDIYLPNFPDHVAAFHRWNNPIFVPESRGDATGVANAFYAIGQHASLGYSPFGIDEPARSLGLNPENASVGPRDLEDAPLARGYAVLRNLTPLILEHQSKGDLGAAWLTSEKPAQDLPLGDYILHVKLHAPRSAASAQQPESGYALAIPIAPDEYIIAGTNAQVTFVSRVNDSSFTSVAEATRGSFQGSEWHAERQMSGDDIMLGYHLAEDAVNRQSGSGLSFGPNGPVIQRVKLYQYR